MFVWSKEEEEEEPFIKSSEACEPWSLKLIKTWSSWYWKLGTGAVSCKGMAEACGGVSRGGFSSMGLFILSWLLMGGLMVKGVVGDRV